MFPASLVMPASRTNALPLSVADNAYASVRLCLRPVLVSLLSLSFHLADGLIGLVVFVWVFGVVCCFLFGLVRLGR